MPRKAKDDWTIEEDKILYDNYQYGSVYCAQILKKSKISIQVRAKKLRDKIIFGELDWDINKLIYNNKGKRCTPRNFF